jgi:hypothetical protein
VQFLELLTEDPMLGMHWQVQDWVKVGGPLPKFRLEIHEPHGAQEARLKVRPHDQEMSVVTPPDLQGGDSVTSCVRSRSR